jgi:hypothetical protein
MDLMLTKSDYKKILDNNFDKKEAEMLFDRFIEGKSFDYISQKYSNEFPASKSTIKKITKISEEFFKILGDKNKGGANG